MTRAREVLQAHGGHPGEDGLFLSGHSAGGNIAALLAVGLASGTGAGAAALVANGIAVGEKAAEAWEGSAEGDDGTTAAALPPGRLPSVCRAPPGRVATASGGAARLEHLRLRLRGVLCISGVLSMFRPVDGLRWKTKMFFKGYVQGTFGEGDSETLSLFGPFDF